LPPVSGRWARIQITTATARITVPARRKNTLERSTKRNPSERTVGQRYGGISSMKDERVLLRTVDFSSRAVKIAARKPNTYKPSSAAVPVPRKNRAAGALE